LASEVTNSKAFPIARLDSVEAVTRLVDRVLLVADTQPHHIDVRILTDSHEAGRHYPLFPGASLFVELSAEAAQRVSDEVLIEPGMDDSIIRWGDHLALVAPIATPGLLETLRSLPAAPAEVEADELLADQIDASVLTAIGPACTSVSWSLPRWPPIGELSLPAQAKHADIQATLNCSDIDALVPAQGHLVYLHVGPWPEEEARAAWLAQRVGCEISGDPELGW
jgi:hypothetical protein